MPLIKSPAQIALMKESGRIVAKTIRLVSEIVAPGISPKDLDAYAHELILKEGGKPNFLGYRDYPAATCISVNDVVVHGIPTDVPLKEGDIIGLDFGVVKEGWHADSAWTFAVGEISQEAQRLLNVTREALNQGIAKARHGNTVGDIGAAVQTYVERNGYSVVRDLVGHGIGEKLHDEPHNIPMYGKAGKGLKLKAGMTMCIEPMVNAGTWRVNQLEDNWTIVTADGRLSAHFEHTIAIMDGAAEIITKE